ncbi:hypothetical protein BD626DRAFT_567375 [Schizophyllum amplum]|uniref:EamA domain-containing protein n=1 Tax=Schizophyllum amplum TaxID=97359 RepID=A0A550CL43_9AGAR|nr:hypothetical protein BD626DRAFT_567375 [Auriculariopsis ampla]
MSTRHQYTPVTTQDDADFAVPRSPYIPAFARDEARTAQGSSRRRLPPRVEKVYGRLMDGLAANYGLLLVTASQLFLSLVNVSVKKLNSIDPPVPTYELIGFRMVITFICAQAYMRVRGVPDPLLGPKGVRLLLVFRGFIGFFGIFGLYWSLQYLSLSDATVLSFLAPLATGIVGALVLKEPFTRKQLFAGLISLVGVVLIARPPFIFGSAADLPVPLTDAEGIEDAGAAPIDPAERGTPQDRLMAVGMSLVGVCGATGAYITIRAIGKRAHPLHSLSSFSLQSVVTSSILILATKTKIVIPTSIEWLALLGVIGVCGFIAQVLLTMGLQRETAGRGSLALYTQIVFATILERMFFKAAPSALSVLGTLIIVASAVYVAATKERENKQQDGITLERMDEEAMEEGLLDAEAKPEAEGVKTERIPRIHVSHPSMSKEALTSASLESVVLTTTEDAAART